MMDAAPPRTAHPEWSQSLSTGAAGIALLHIERALAATGSWTTAQEWVTAMTSGPLLGHPDTACLFRGAPAVAFTLNAARQPLYADALDVLDEHIADMIRHRVDRAHQRIDRKQPPALREWDLVSGLTGFGVYLLNRDTDTDLLHEVLAYLVRLTEPLGTLPGWWCLDGPDRTSSQAGGHGNLGVAHGISGPLALLSLAMRHGIIIADHREAIQRICAFLDQCRCDTDGRVWWPGWISMPELRSGAISQSGPQRPSWCYGTPGLARAQQLAALALDDPERRRRAEDALIGCVTDNSQLALLGDASLCHGWAGVVQTVRRAADDGCNDALARCVPDLRLRMNDHLDALPEPPSDGLLEGMAGVKLVQHTTVRATPPISRWDACLLIDG